MPIRTDFQILYHTAPQKCQRNRYLCKIMAILVANHMTDPNYWKIFEIFVGYRNINLDVILVSSNAYARQLFYHH